MKEPNMDTIHALISSVNHGESGMESLKTVGAAIGDDRMRVIIVKVLSWMKSQHRMGKLRPLQLKLSQSWSRELSKLMSDQQVFSDVLELQDGAVVLNSTLSEKAQLELCALVDREYEPKLMT